MRFMDRFSKWLCCILGFHCKVQFVFKHCDDQSVHYLLCCEWCETMFYHRENDGKHEPF